MPLDGIGGQVRAYSRRSFEKLATGMRSAGGMECQGRTRENATFVSVCRPEVWMSQWSRCSRSPTLAASPHLGRRADPGWCRATARWSRSRSHPAAVASSSIVHEPNNELVAITCRMYRKDRRHPVEVTKYLSKCDQSHGTLEDAAQDDASQRRAQRKGKGWISDGSTVEDEAEQIRRYQRCHTTGTASTAKVKGGNRRKKGTKYRPQSHPSRRSKEPERNSRNVPDTTISMSSTGEVRTPGELLSELDDSLAPPRPSRRSTKSMMPTI